MPSLEREVKDRCFGFVFQWPEVWRLARGYNWINFDVIACQIEYGSYKGRYFEGRFVLLGVGFWFEWVHRLSRSVWLADMDQQTEAIRSGDAKLHRMCLECGHISEEPESPDGK